MGVGASSEPCAVLSRSRLAATPWLALESLTYRDATGKERKWDLVTRVTKKKESSADAVAVFAKLQAEGKETKTLLVKQFRPPVDKYTLELPAGLIDEGETAGEAALRELKEETGYTATVESVSPPLAMSPGMTDESIHFVTVVVDLDSPANANPKQALEETESIDVVEVPLKELSSTLASASQSGAMVFAGLWFFASALRA